MRLFKLLLLLLIPFASFGQSWKIKPKQIGGAGAADKVIVSDANGNGVWLTAPWVTTETDPTVTTYTKGLTSATVLLNEIKKVDG